MRREQVLALARAHYDRDESRVRTTLLQIAATETTEKNREQWKRIMARDTGYTTPILQGQISGGALSPVRDVDISDITMSQPMRARVDRWIAELRHRAALSERGVAAQTAALFDGPSGVGKTMLAAAVASSLRMPCYSVRSSAVIDSHLGVTGARLRKALDAARAQPIVLVCDEFDSIASKRCSGTAADTEQARITNTLIQELDAGIGDSIFIGTTNSPGTVDGAVKRRCFTVSFPAPSDDEIRAFMRHVAAGHGMELGDVEVPASYAEAEQLVFNEVRSRLIAEFEAA